MLSDVVHALKKRALVKGMQELKKEKQAVRSVAPQRKRLAQRMNDRLEKLFVPPPLSDAERKHACLQHLSSSAAL